MSYKIGQLVKIVDQRKSPEEWVFPVGTICRVVNIMPAHPVHVLVERLKLHSDDYCTFYPEGLMLKEKT